VTVKNVNVLIVDDEKMVINILKDFLEDCGLEIMTAHSAEEGLTIINRHDIDVAIVDMRLPDMVGNDFIIRANDIKKGIHECMHTGSIDYSVPDALVEIGVNSDSILYKPVIDMKTIYDAIIKKISN